VAPWYDEKVDQPSGLIAVGEAINGLAEPPSPAPNEPKERPGTKTLDYIALGLLLAPPAVVLDMYLKDLPINWRKITIAAPVCWLAGGLAVLASHGWQSWRSADRSVLPYLVAAENKFWVKGLIVAAAMGFALASSSILSDRTPSGPPIVIHDPPTAEDIAKATAPIRAELEGVKRELATTKQQQLQAARSSPATGPVRTPEPTPAKQGPITWHVDSQLMLVSGGEPNAVVGGLLFQGTSTASVSIKEAYVVSGLTGRKQTLVANVQSKGGYYPVDKVDIPPGAPVQLVLIFDPGLPLRDFMDQWGKFRVTIIYSNGEPYERDYDEAFVRQQLRQHVPNAFGPRVTPRDDK
jgi:hypothetical protein